MTFTRVIPNWLAILVLALGAILYLATTVSAHETGASFSATTSPYVVDIGYDPVAFIAGQSVRFDFTLREEKTGNAVPFDQVWVRITDANDTVLATGLFHQRFGPTTLLYVFSAPGSYKLEPSFRDASGKEIATATFAAVVTADEAATAPISRYAQLLGIFVIGCFLGSVGGHQLLKRFRSA